MNEPYVVITGIIDGENRTQVFTLPIVLNKEGDDFEILGTDGPRILVENTPIRIIKMDTFWTNRTNDRAVLMRANQEKEKALVLEQRRKLINDREIQKSIRRHAALNKARENGY